MSILLDTDFLVSYWNPAERQHDMATELFEELLRGSRGRMFVTDFIVDEAATLAMRAREPSQARAFLRFLLGNPPSPHVLVLLHVGRDVFLRAADRFLRASAPG